jgi:2-polyprenyl-6-methoxyphenol hydroxylase-like FAD-dependent oxidoreductase
MPQWDFLNFLARHAKAHPHFTLRMQAEASELIASGERIGGCRAVTPEGTLEIRAELTVGADGRHSTVRAEAGLPVENLGAPMDVFWMRISRRSSDPGEALGRIETARMLVTINRGDYWQCAHLIAKGSAEAVRGRGLPVLRQSVRDLAPWLGDRVEELKSWDDICCSASPSTG